MSSFNQDIEPIILSSAQDTSKNANIITVPITGGLRLEGNKVALAFLSLYYSWRNITSAYNNNSFSYKWNGTTYAVNLPDGFYEFSDINNYLQTIVMNTNGHYLIDGNGNYIYYLSITANPTYYTTTVVATVLPSSLPTGWTDPHSIIASMGGKTAQIVIPSNNFTTLTGFTAGTYPSTAQTSTYSVNSQSIPEISPVTSVLVTCDIATDNKSTFTNAIHAFSTGATTYGSLITIQPTFPIFYRTRNATVTSITIGFYDQNYNPLAILDKEIVCQLLLSTPR